MPVRARRQAIGTGHEHRQGRIDAGGQMPDTMTANAQVLKTEDHALPSADAQAAVLSTGIEVGDRFYKTGQPHRVWVVRKIYCPETETIPHVVIEREDTPGERTLMSVYALLDESCYRRDRRDPISVNVEGKRRRRSDFLRFF